MPIEYKNTSLIHAWQWAIGLEWYLLVQDPWRVVMSTDHPNGGSFLAYPQIIRLLMDRTYRQDMLKTVPRKVREQSALADLDREYTLSEIAIITRAGPARILGLKHKGHLGPGADADITIYTPDAEPGDDVRSCLATSSRPAGSSSSRVRSARKRTARRCTSPPSTTATSSRISSDGSRSRTRSGGGTIPSTSTYLRDHEVVD